MVANHYGLGNLVAIIDHNRMQSLDFCEATISLHPFADKWRAFGWNTIEVDGHDHGEMVDALEACRGATKPTVIIAQTIKGKGISYMEQNILWHYRFPHAGEEYDAAMSELKAQRPDGVKHDEEVVR